MKLTIISLLTISAFAQAVRVDPQPVTTVSGNPAPGSFAPVLAIPGTIINLCNYPSCSVPLTSYTSWTAATPCPASAPVVLAGTLASGCSLRLLPTGIRKSCHRAQCSGRILSQPRLSHPRTQLVTARFPADFRRSTPRKYKDLLRLPALKPSQ
jgi:hypothetical protein